MTDLVDPLISTSIGGGGTLLVFLLLDAMDRREVVLVKEYRLCRMDLGENVSDGGGGGCSSSDSLSPSGGGGGGGGGCESNIGRGGGGGTGAVYLDGDGSASLL